MNLDKLKEAARKYEQREDWRRAIDVYIQAIQEAESETGETTQDPALYNRLGDLQLKAGDLVSALRAYEEAAELYTDQGFFNNAIALCGKILRINPNRVPAHLRLAQLHARKNFVGEARRSLAEYVARMSGPRQRTEAVAALELFADQFSGNPELRSMLVDLLRDATPGGGGGGPEDPDFERLARRLEGGGEAGGRPGSGPPWPAPTGETGSERSRQAEHLGRGVAFHNDLIFLDTGTDGEGRIPIEAIDGLLPRASEGLVPTKAGRARDAAPHGATALDIRVAARESPAYHQDVRGPDFEIVPSDVPPAPDDIITADSAGPAAPPPPETLPSEGVAAPGGHPLEAALAHLESENRWDEALEVASQLVRLEPEVIARYQKRVELAYYSGKRSALIRAYLELAAVLRSKGGDAARQAILVYRRVLVHDPDNAAARSGLDALTAPLPVPGLPVPPPPPEVNTEFVDLAALILDEEPPGAGPGDTRIRIGEKPLDEDEERVFREALAEFKRGVESRIDPDDFQSHYDLGIAFKEMGLVDEAIAQFQKALRAPEGRLKAAEQLGIAFYEQGQYRVAEAVLRRANTLEGPEDEKIGVLYWFGRALEAQEKAAEALRLYEQAVALDIRFLDVRDRVNRLAAEPGR